MKYAFGLKLGLLIMFAGFGVVFGEREYEEELNWGLGCNRVANQSDRWYCVYHGASSKPMIEIFNTAGSTLDNVYAKKAHFAQWASNGDHPHKYFGVLYRHIESFEEFLNLVTVSRTVPNRVFWWIAHGNNDYITVGPEWWGEEAGGKCWDYISNIANGDTNVSRLYAINPNNPDDKRLTCFEVASNDYVLAIKKEAFNNPDLTEVYSFRWQDYNTDGLNRACPELS